MSTARNPKPAGTTILLVSLTLLTVMARAGAGHERQLPLAHVTDAPASFACEVGDSGRLTWWLPRGPSELVLPICGGIVVSTSRDDLMQWLRDGSPWSLSQLPAFGARYGDRVAVIIVPWPHYAELVVEGDVGVRFSLPADRRDAAPCEVVAVWRTADPLEVARAFREWRCSAEDTGAIPRPRTLRDKARDLPAVSRLFGAPHIYLWGPALFSRHDVDRPNWPALARALLDAAPDSFAGRLVARFGAHQQRTLRELAESEWPLDYLTAEVAAAIERALADPALLHLPTDTPLTEVVVRNREALAAAFPRVLHDPATWGDGPSLPMLDALRAAGLEQALLILSDLYARAPRPDVAARAAELGFLLGPYDSYHSVHSPTADPDTTWETAQFDQVAFEQGRVLDADGAGHPGFRGRGYHFSPLAAWPYVRQRVGTAMADIPYSAWFLDCDATAECFDDYHPRHTATRIDDTAARRHRLRWLEAEHGLVVGSEDGSALFADVIHFGHGVHTPYIGHLDPAFRDPRSPHFLGRHWPPDTPEAAFKPVPAPPSVLTPYFEPTLRVPLYQAALGDEVIVTHHWSFDSLKFDNIAVARELLEILYMVPPMYHLNRATWPERRERMTRHLAFWGPLHRQLAAAPLTAFEWLSEDRLLQRTTFRLPEGYVTITVNFSDEERAGLPARSAAVAGPINTSHHTYHPALPPPPSR